MSDSTEHLVKSFDNDLKRLRDMLTEMGGIVESQVAMAAEAIMNRDSVAATRVVEEDPKVDALEREVEQFVIRMLALRQPMAGDLRRIVAAPEDHRRPGTDRRLRRQRRQAQHRAGQYNLPYSLAGLAHMAHLVQEQLKSIIDALGTNDTAKAIEVWRSDRVVDDIYNALFRELITYMMEDPRNITPCTHLLFIAKNLERIGDHATNIAETVYYAVEGEVSRMFAAQGRHIGLCGCSAQRLSEGDQRRRRCSTLYPACPSRLSWWWRMRRRSPRCCATTWKSRDSASRKRATARRH